MEAKQKPDLFEYLRENREHVNALLERKFQPDYVIREFAKFRRDVGAKEVLLELPHALAEIVADDVGYDERPFALSVRQYAGCVLGRLISERSTLPDHVYHNTSGHTVNV
jgi:hypothetical protein